MIDSFERELDLSARYVGAPSDSVTYDVRAFSMRRATSRTTVDFSFDGGASVTYCDLDGAGSNAGSSSTTRKRWR